MNFKGGGLYTTIDPANHLGVELSVRQVFGIEGVHERTYELGPRLYLTHGRFMPYGKVLFGRAVFNFPNDMANQAFTEGALGGGLDYRVSSVFYLRADYEYQRWLGFGTQVSAFPGSLSPVSPRLGLPITLAGMPIAPAAGTRARRFPLKRGDNDMSIFDSPERTHQSLIDVGYLTKREISTVIYLAGKQNRPLLLEGPAGAGKTELALSVAKAEKMRFIRLQCYEGISDKQAVGDYNRALQEMFVILQSKNQTCSWDEIRKEIIGRAFFIAGPLLEALESPER